MPPYLTPEPALSLTSTPPSPSSPSNGAKVSSPFSDNNRRRYLNDPAACAPIRVDVDAPQNERDGQIIAAVREICPAVFCGDGPPSARELSVRQLGGGLSNHLFVVTASASRSAGDGVRAVLVRVHGEEDGSRDTDTSDSSSSSSSGGFVDRKVENRVLARLSRSGLAPKFHGRFVNGRVEEFYIGFDPLLCSEMSSRRFAGGIAEAMARLHRERMPEGMLSSGAVAAANGGGAIWDRVEGWLDMALENGAEGYSSCGDYAIRPEEMRKEWRWLRSELTGQPDASIANSPWRYEAVSFFREVVFAHMDCQSLNILSPSTAEQGAPQEEGEEAPVRLIDFEYADLNPRAADLGNTFCEHCDMNNLAANYEVEYPSAESQDLFLRRYIRSADCELAKRLDDAGDVAWDEFLSEARDEVGRHALISHMGWAVWAVAQSQRSAIDFDYIKYAALRMEGYRLFKGWFWTS